MGQDMILTDTTGSFMSVRPANTPDSFLVILPRRHTHLRI